MVIGKTIFKSSPMRGCGGSGPGKMLSNFFFSVNNQIMAVHIEEYLCFPVTVLLSPERPEFIFMG